MLPDRVDGPPADGNRPAPARPDASRPGAAFEQDLRELTFPAGLPDLLPRPVRARWITLLWVVLVVLVFGLLAVRVAYLGLTSVKW